MANAKSCHKPIAVGGPFTHALPEAACADADWVCFGEAESIMERLVSDLRADSRGRQYHGGSATNMESVENYRELVGAIYQPEAYFARTLPALLELKARAPLGAARRHGAELLAVLLKEFYHLGFRAKTMRYYFWKALGQILWKRPGALESFVFDCAVFQHLHQHADYVQRELAKYLSAPAPDDVLDRVVDSSRISQLPLPQRARNKPSIAKPMGYCL